MMKTTINTRVLTTVHIKTFALLNEKQQLNPIRYHGENRVGENNSGTHYALNTPVIFGNSQGENYVIG